MSDASKPALPGIAFGSVTPVLRVGNVSVSIEYYVRALGFRINFLYPDSHAPDFASISRGNCCLFLCAGDQGNPGSWVWIDGKDVEALYEEYLGSGAKIRNPPTNYPWGSMEMQVEDPDGNVLRIGSEAKKGQPIGDWLDMYGVRWRKLPDGSHQRIDPSEGIEKPERSGARRTS